MNINFTLIVQAFNFFVVYAILRHFLFRPTVAEIEQERAQEKDLQNTIAHGAQANAALSKQNKEQWELYQQEFLAHIPQVNSADLFIHKDLGPALKAPELKIENLSHVRSEVVQSIIKGVERLS